VDHNSHGEPLVRDIPANSEVQFQFTSPELTKLLVNKKVHTKENGDVWRIVAETGDSGNLTVRVIDICIP
jgi:hypothetical protein